MSNFDNKAVYELKFRDKFDYKIMYSMNPYRLLFPCNIYSLRENGFVLEKDALSIKEYLMEQNHIFVNVLGHKPLIFSRKEISHLYGPFEYETKKTMSKYDAATLKDTTVEFMQKRYKDYDEIPVHIFQNNFGAITSLRKNQRRDITTTITDIRQYGVIYNSIWLEDVIKNEKRELINLRYFLIEENLPHLVSELDAYMESEEYQRKIENYKEEICHQKKTNQFYLEKFENFLNAAR